MKYLSSTFNQIRFQNAKGKKKTESLVRARRSSGLGEYDKRHNNIKERIYVQPLSLKKCSLISVTLV
jgi:hypothetical protein